MTTKRIRRNFTAEQKAAILRQHFVDKVPVSDLCDEHQLQPSVFYDWQRRLMDNAAVALSAGRAEKVSTRQTKQLEDKIESLEGKLAKKDGVMAELLAEIRGVKKTTWGALTGRWVPHDTRDEIVIFVSHWSTKCEVATTLIIGWLGIARGKFYAWRARYGTVHEQGRPVPRDHWIVDWERQAILDFHERHPLEGYRRLTFMMLDDDVVAVSPSTTYRVLRAAGRLDRWNKTPSRKGTGFVQPLAAHDHWHIDIAYLNVASTFYYLCTLLDGYSRAVVHWEIREAMREPDIEIIVQRARETFRGCDHASSRITALSSSRVTSRISCASPA